MIAIVMLAASSNCFIQMLTRAEPGMATAVNRTWVARRTGTYPTAAISAGSGTVERISSTWAPPRRRSAHCGRWFSLGTWPRTTSNRYEDRHADALQLHLLRTPTNQLSMAAFRRSVCRPVTENVIIWFRLLPNMSLRLYSCLLRRQWRRTLHSLNFTIDKTKFLKQTNEIPLFWLFIFVEAVVRWLRSRRIAEILIEGVCSVFILCWLNRRKAHKFRTSNSVIIRQSFKYRPNLLQSMSRTKHARFIEWK